MNDNSIKIQPFCPNLGAIITGVDLSKHLSNIEFKIIEKAFLKYHVLFFQNQKEISPEQHIAKGQNSTLARALKLIEEDRNSNAKYLIAKYIK